jgi:hypothetical protein
VRSLFHLLPLVKAYQERAPVVCIGDLIKQDDTFIVKNSQTFSLDESWKN